MFDAFTLRVANELNDRMPVDEAKAVAIDILESGDFQKNIPDLIAAVQAAGTTREVTTIVCRTAMSGERKRDQIARWR